MILDSFYFQAFRPCVEYRILKVFSMISHKSFMIISLNLQVVQLVTKMNWN